MGASRRPAFPAPSMFPRADHWQSSGRSCRENAAHILKLFER